jgi:hypothetical protein
MFLMESYFMFSFQEDHGSPLNLATQIVTGAQHYHFELSAWHQKGGEWHFCIQSMQNVQTSEENQEQEVYLPFSAFPWLRQKMVEMLTKHDGSERIDKMPTIPKWAKQGFSSSKFSYK